ncbi:MAG: hypothetical protein GX189_03050 [Clostridiales bacterium]|nr:hypothetical protein [Clostridiales bacterium]
MSELESGGKKWSCAACNVPLVLKKTVFEYMGHTVSHEVPRCPKCGAIFIPKELAEGRMAEVEEQLEDK